MLNYDELRKVINKIKDNKKNKRQINFAKK